MRSLVLALLAISALGLVSFQAASARQPQDHLASNMVLIIRHSEKPETGNGLTAQGEERAHLYVKYFQPFQDQLPPIEIDSLYAGADSKSSIRPTLTLEPLSKAISLPINSSISSKDSTALVAELRSHPHGHSPLIAWRHGEMPALLTAFGASPDKLLPNGRWPDDVYDWVVVLTMGPDGQLVSQKLIHEQLTVNPAAK
ncbi:hypothetical protein [Tunturibacter empetritectus]|uniref:Flagellar basal body-associated protein FliL n=1 Tax=Tunturiibacter empetritectus TaxID=3069691 RepID=A0A7W8IHE1_9BACT|nr:hypothetical protein [Edaphobacter lichenicola]MBB5317077.1 hypothetical protein [Edaphobacter lichenicola]